MTTAQALLKIGTEKLPRLDAEILLSHALKLSRTQLHACFNEAVVPAAETYYLDLLQKRQQGYPVAYLTGKKEFWEFSLRVTPDVLVPRPETEILVEKTLQLLPHDASLQILELGTGSGAIALALAYERLNWHITAVDCADGALKCAEQNAHQLLLSNLTWIKSDWYATVGAVKFHAIVSNPPYVAADDKHLSGDGVRFEPVTALVGGKTGLEALTHIIVNAHQYLLPGGWLILEHGFDQGPRVKTLMQNHGFSQIQQFQDYANQDRATCGKRS